MTTREYEIVIEPHFVKNFWRGRDGYMPMAIVEHMMQGTLEETRRYFNGEEGAYYVSAHYGVARDGRIWQFVRDEDTAWANGILQQPDTSIDWLQEVYEEKINANLVTLAIEYEGYSGEELTEAQYEAALVLHQHLLERWNIPVTRAHLLGHDRFDSVERSRNPGPAFPWERLLADLAHLMPLSKPQQTSPAATEYPLNLEPLPALDKFGFLTESEKPLPDFYNVDFGFLAEPEPEPEIKLINLPDFQESDAKIGPVSDLEEFRFATEPEMRPEGIFPFTEPELVNFASFQESATEVELLPDLYGVSPTVEPEVEQVSQFKPTELEMDWLGSLRESATEPATLSSAIEPEAEMDWLGSLRESATEPATLSSAIEAAVELDWLSLLQAEELEPITATAPKPKVESDWLSALRDPEAEPLIAVESEPESLVEVQNLAPNLESEWLDLLQSTKAESEPLTVVEPKVEPIAEFQAEGESEWLDLLQATKAESEPLTVVEPKVEPI
ncbi:MAG: N-acetylmuramoyl-L-alanine amidase, partial [Chloroflexi bacterium]|nr:N-acetylmuramoyl-L-alanine amidase [Chloroflexota bacterium]